MTQSSEVARSKKGNSASEGETRYTPTPPPPVPDFDWDPDRARAFGNEIVGLWGEMLERLDSMPVNR
ncbi:MAG: hypothetical protein ABIT38_07665, partial [Gemmatimonadaceae bacterium]